MDFLQPTTQQSAKTTLSTLSSVITLPTWEEFVELYLELLIDSVCFSGIVSGISLMVYRFFRPQRQDGGKQDKNK